MRGEARIHIDAAVATVWALVTDVTRIGEFSRETFEAQWRRPGRARGRTNDRGMRQTLAQVKAIAKAGPQ